MPCRYETGDESAARLSSELSKVTRLLCSACKVLQRSSIMWKTQYSDELQEWWEEHQKLKEREDREHERLKQDLLKKNALSKLTPEEKKVLGL